MDSLCATLSPAGMSTYVMGLALERVSRGKFKTPLDAATYVAYETIPYDMMYTRWTKEPEHKFDYDPEPTRFWYMSLRNADTVARHFADRDPNTTYTENLAEMAVRNALNMHKKEEEKRKAVEEWERLPWYSRLGRRLKGEITPTL